MGKIVVSENVSLDGVMEDPTGEEGFEHGGWFEQHMGSDFPAWAETEAAEAMAADALLLGRGSDAYFGSRWASRDGAWADRLNRLPKYVVSSTLTEPVWTNATILRGDVGEEVAALKARVEGEIVVYASRPLVQTLLARDLVDELRLIVFPVVLGTGEKVFGPATAKTALKLNGTRAVGSGLARLTYEVSRTA
jgi:dihydrofolate reductase